MSCAQVMYQPYAGGSYVPQSTTFGRVGSPQETVTPPTVPTGTEQKYKVSSSPADATAASSASGEEEPQHLQQQQQQVKFLNSNCVLVTNYCGDAAQVVDQHFARALSQAAACHTRDGHTTDKEGVPMSQRNLPASFWNSTYHSRTTMTSLGHGSAPDPYSDPYHAAQLHGLHQTDPWHYALASQAAYQGRDLAAYGAATSSTRFNTYGSLLFPGAQRGPSAAHSSKAEWAARGYPDVSAELSMHPHPHPHPHGSSHPHAHPLDPSFAPGHVGYGNMSGLESSLQAAASGKDSYWL